jgi:hypothetical protein
VPGLVGNTRRKSPFFTFGDTLLFSSSNLDTWGWIYLIVGAVVVVAGIAVFFRAALGIVVGIIAAFAQALFAFFWSSHRTGRARW